MTAVLISNNGINNQAFINLAGTVYHITQYPISLSALQKCPIVDSDFIDNTFSNSTGFTTFTPIIVS